MNTSALQRAGQYTALVDILFATIGIFVIVFALQELKPPVELRPASYDAVLVCDSDRALRLYRADEQEPVNYGLRAIGSDLQDELGAGGRVLIALTTECTTDPGDGIVVEDKLRALERKLTGRNSDKVSALLLLEFAPLAKGGEAALLDRFVASSKVPK